MSTTVVGNSYHVLGLAWQPNTPLESVCECNHVDKHYAYLAHVSVQEALVKGFIKSFK
jgi:hypothetical protein